MHKTQSPVRPREAKFVEFLKIKTKQQSSTVKVLNSETANCADTERDTHKNHKTPEAQCFLPSKR